MNNNTRKQCDFAIVARTNTVHRANDSVAENTSFLSFLGEIRRYKQLTRKNLKKVTIVEISNSKLLVAHYGMDVCICTDILQRI